MGNEDYYVSEAMAAIRDVLDRLLPEIDEESRGDVAAEIAFHLDHSHMLIGGYRRGSY